MYRKLLLLLLLTYVVCLWGHDDATERKARLSEPMSSRKIIAQNEKIRAAVGEDGRFTIGTTDGKPLLWGFSREGATSHTHFNIDGEIWGTYSDDSGTAHPPAPTIAMYPSLRDSAIECRWLIDSVLVIQRLTPAYNGDKGTIFIEYAFENISSESHDVGLLMFFDTKINTNDYAPISTEYGYFSVEREFNAPEIPNFWQAYELSPFQTDEYLVGEAIISGMGAVPPDRLIYGDYWHYKSVEWDCEFIGGPYSDSSILYRWDTSVIEPGETRYISTYYGEGAIATGEGGLLLSLSFPLELNPLNCDELTPNPFNVNLIVSNPSSDTAYAVLASLDLPDGFTILDGSMTESVDPPVLLPGETGTNSWLVYADGSSVPSGVNLIEANANARDFSTVTVPRPLTINIGDRIPPSAELVYPRNEAVFSSDTFECVLHFFDDSGVILDDTEFELGSEVFTLDDIEFLTEDEDSVRIKVPMSYITSIEGDFSLIINDILDEFGCDVSGIEYEFVSDWTPPEIELVSHVDGETIHEETFNIRFHLFDRHTSILGDSIRISINDSLFFTTHTAGISFDERFLSINSSVFSGELPEEFPLDICIWNVMDTPDIGIPNVAEEICYSLDYNYSPATIELIDPIVTGYMSCDTLRGTVLLKHVDGVADSTIAVFVNDEYYGGITNPQISYESDSLLFFNIPLEDYDEPAISVGVCVTSVHGVVSDTIEWSFDFDRTAPEITLLTTSIISPTQTISYNYLDELSGVDESAILVELVHLGSSYIPDYEIDDGTITLNSDILDLIGCEELIVNISLNDLSVLCDPNITTISDTFNLPCSAPVITDRTSYTTWLCNDYCDIRWDYTDLEGIIPDSVFVKFNGVNYTSDSPEITISATDISASFDITDLADGLNYIVLYNLTDSFYVEADADTVEIMVDHSSPVITDISPAPSTVIRDTNDTLSIDFDDLFSGIDPTLCGITINGESRSYDFSGLNLEILLEDYYVDDLDSFRICITLIDSAMGCGGNRIDSCYTYYFDFNAPIVNMVFPIEGYNTGCDDTIVFEVVDPDGLDYSSLQILFGGVVFTQDSSQVYLREDNIIFMPPSTMLSDGANSIRIIIADIFGNITVEEYNITYDFTAPIISAISPLPDETITDFRSDIVLEIVDNLSGVELSSLVITINGVSYSIGSEEITVDGSRIVFATESNFGNRNEVYVYIEDANTSCPNYTEMNYEFYCNSPGFSAEIVNPVNGTVLGCDVIEYLVNLSGEESISIDSLKIFLNSSLITPELTYYAEELSFAISSEQLVEGENVVIITGFSDEFGNLYSDSLYSDIIFDSQPPELVTAIPASGSTISEISQVTLDFNDYSRINHESVEIIYNAEILSYSWQGDSLILDITDRINNSISFNIVICDKIDSCSNCTEYEIEYDINHPVTSIDVQYPFDRAISHLPNQGVSVVATGRYPESAFMVCNEDTISEELLREDLSNTFIWEPADDYWLEGENNLLFYIDDMSYQWSFMLDTEAPTIENISPLQATELKEIPENVYFSLIDEISGVDFRSIELNINGITVPNSEILVNRPELTINLTDFVSDPEIGDTIFVSVNHLEDNIPDYGDANILTEPIEWFYVYIGKGWIIYPDEVITPNNDGYNDEIYFEVYYDTDINIYNTSGVMVRNLRGEGLISWSAFDNNGKALKPGVYIYTIEQNGDFVYKGTITIAR